MVECVPKALRNGVGDRLAERPRLGQPPALGETQIPVIFHMVILGAPTDGAAASPQRLLQRVRRSDLMRMSRECSVLEVGCRTIDGERKTEMKLVIQRSQQDIKGMLGGHKGMSFTL